MALACAQCNTSRGHYETSIWLNQVDWIGQKDKGLALGRIEAFRNFSNYEEYSESDSKEILSQIKKVDGIIKMRKAAQTEYLGTEQGGEIKEMIQKVVRDLEKEIGMKNNGSRA